MDALLTQQLPHASGIHSRRMRPISSTSSPHELLAMLQDILEQRLLRAVLQPVMGLRAGDIVGYEGLIRGPVGSPLQMPGWLFSIAERHGLEATLEHLSRQVVIETFSRLGLPGKLFLNVSPDVLTQSPEQNGNLVAYMRDAGLRPERVIIELTENQPTYDLDRMREAMLYYRALGFEVAIDDLGEGFSSLRLWSELRPEFVKIDKHFIQGVSQDALKLEFVKAIQQIATCCGSRVIAEGIEDRADFRVVRDLGIAYGQGYFIAMPEANPVRVPSDAARQALRLREIAVYPGLEPLSNRSVKARKLLIEVKAVSPQTVNDEVYMMFNSDNELMSLPVVEDGIPRGLIYRHKLIDRFARPYRRELYGRKSCQMFMDHAPLIIEHDVSIQELSSRIAQSDPRHLSDGFIITENGRYLGIGTAGDLIREITQMQITAARYANPLTLLPGNVPIAEHIERLINAGIPFSACYCDLDHFKPFNDAYGYQKGDEMIRLTARILSEQCDPERDFIGHIGGDDFLAMFQSADWEQRCMAALRQFELLLPTLITEEDFARGGYTGEDRRGQAVCYPFPTLSIGAILVSARSLVTHLEVSTAAAEAKKHAKRIAGNSLFVERRKLFD
jgi:EAL domain-containing protein (putative c-di-GMP-specific phosphodiesterase class I)/GGDEF domain-containing protein